MENILNKLNTHDIQVWALTRGNRFVYFNFDKLSEDEVIWCINQKFYKSHGYFPNINDPKSFNEKLQWYKLYYRNDLMTKYVDKYLFKEQINKDLGKGYVIPMLGAWDNINKIDFNALPDSFVLKVNHCGGGKVGIKIVKNKNSVNIDEIKSHLDNHIQKWNNVYYSTFDWAYKNIKPLIIAEKYLENSDNQLIDYKFLCFNGRVKYFWIDKDRYTGHIRNLYDVEKNKLDCDFIYPRGEEKLALPTNFDKMIEIAEALSKPFPHVRVDFYEVDNKVYVGELTFYTESGYGKFYDKKWDYKIGESFDLSTIDKNNITTNILE